MLGAMSATESPTACHTFSARRTPTVRWGLSGSCDSLRKGVRLGKGERAAAWGSGVSGCCDTFLLDDCAAGARYAGGPVGDLRLHPALDRLTPLAGQPGWAWAPADRYRQDGTVRPLDARS